MDSLLFLCHRIPYPPDKGDKIRSYHLLCHLSQHYQIYLGTFIDDPRDRQYREAVAALCADSYFVEVNPRLGKLKSLLGLLRDTPLTAEFYRHPGLADWITACCQQATIQRALVFSSGMAPFIQGADYQFLQRVCDLVDVDSDKWSQYSQSAAWPMNAIYRRESDTLAQLEAQIVADFDASVLVSEQEADWLRERLPAHAERIHAVHNGVDSDYFQPGDYPDPYGTGGPVVVFTGAMDYWANVHAVCWFADAVLPQLREAIPEVRFAVVGSRPDAAVQRLADDPGILVTGRVADMRPYLAHAAVAVAPLRIARGVQNKVLEAMAMARPVVTSQAAMAGIKPHPRLHELVADDPQQQALLLLKLLQHGDQENYGQLGREWVLKEYHWGHNLDLFQQLLESRGEATSCS